MNEISLSAYLKQMLEPEIAIAICNHKFGKDFKEDLKKEKLLQYLLDRLLVNEDLSANMYDFVEVVGYIMQQEFKNYGQFYIEVDELDNVFYVLVGKMAQAGIPKAYVKQFLVDCFKSFYGLINKKIPDLVFEYQNKKEQLPNQLSGFDK